MSFNQRTMSKDNFIILSAGSLKHIVVNPTPRDCRGNAYHFVNAYIGDSRNSFSVLARARVTCQPSQWSSVCLQSESAELLHELKRIDDIGRKFTEEKYPGYAFKSSFKRFGILEDIWEVKPFAGHKLPNGVAKNAMLEIRVVCNGIWVDRQRQTTHIRWGYADCSVLGQAPRRQLPSEYLFVDDE